MIRCDQSSHPASGPCHLTHTPVETLELLRSTVLVIDQAGTILRAHGGGGRPLGYRPQDLVGRNGIELVAPEHHHVMALLACSSAGVPVVSTPQPFPVRLIGPGGVTKTWDCTPSGYSRNGQTGWVLLMTCREDQNAAIEAMECFISGGTALEIAAVIAQRHHTTSTDGWRKNTVVIHRLAGDAPNRNPQWHALDPALGTEPALVEAVERCLNDPQAPWQNIAPGAAVSCRALPAKLRRAADQVGLSKCAAFGVGVEGKSHIVFLRFSNFNYAQQANSQLADQAVESVLVRALVAERSSDLLHLAVRSDPITGIANRLSFDEAIAATDQATEPAVLFVDIDRFKAVNDTFGHAAGDATLREVASRIVRACRPHDLVARIGGDEFAVILHDVTPVDAEHVADRIRTSVSAPLPQGCGPDAVSVTVGIAAPDPDVSLGELVELADRAMLVEKGPSGRNAEKHELALDASLFDWPDDIVVATKALATIAGG